MSKFVYLVELKGQLVIFKMHGLILDLEKDYKKSDVVAVRSGDTVKVTQRVKEASKERLQVFEGLAIRVDRANSLTYRITVRKITSGIGVEKSFLVHSPNVVRIEILKRAKVRRNYLSYMRQRIGKAARLKNVDFDKAVVNEFSQAQTPKLETTDDSAEVVAEIKEESNPVKEDPISDSDQQESQEVSSEDEATEEKQSN